MEHGRPHIKALLHIAADRSIQYADLVDESGPLHEELRKSGKLRERTVRMPIPPEAGIDRESLKRYLSRALDRFQDRDHPSEDHWMLLSIEVEDPQDQDLSVEGVLRDLSQQFQEQLCYLTESRGPQEEPALMSRLEELVQRHLESVVDQLAGTAPNEQTSNEVRYGFGWALGRWLAEWYLGRLEPNQEPGFDDELQRAGLDPVLEVSELSLDVGQGLVYLISQGKDSPLVAEVQTARRELAEHTGFVMPAVNFREADDLAHNEYRLYLREREVARGRLKLGHILAAGDRTLLKRLGELIEHPAVEGLATWIRPDRSAEATALGCQCLLPGEVIGQHILDVVEAYSWQLMSIQATSQLLDRLARYEPALVMELDRANVPTRLIRHVLRDLLREGLPIRDLVSILEAILDLGEAARTPEAVTEAVRGAIAPSVFVDLLDEEGVLEAVGLSQSTERFLRDAAERAPTGLPNAVVNAFVEATDQVLDRPDEILIVPAPLRLLVRRLTELTHPDLLVLSDYEIPPGARLALRGTIHLDYLPSEAAE
ncbi:MAG: FHIPEP family type III secretion protein [Armatimonadetes bacterium]|nr:FHIPEP family type III secretion protein [Armatimonadota bacterium]